MTQPNRLDPEQFLSRKSFIELNARERAQALFDQGTYRELLGPFDRLESPWLPMQGVVPQADDGVIVARGDLGRKRLSDLGNRRAISGRKHRRSFGGKDRRGA